ncbi:MAG: DNA alkylation repair protein [Lachnospiraceae bacterium]|nr:DNA alkylation repair protein [Lachnospiraceae bacterium]
MDIRQRLLELQDEKYKQFSSGLIPGCDNMIGVRIPEVRKLAKEIARNNGEEYLQLSSLERCLFEEKMLYGIVIGYSKLPLQEKFIYLQKFIPFIDNWSINDTVCASFRIEDKEKKEWLDFLQPYLLSEQEYAIRFGVVMLLNRFIQKEYLQTLYEIFDKVLTKDYYAMMAVAWAVSICFAKFPEETKEYLKNCILDERTYRKAIQKACESYQVSTQDKQWLRCETRYGNKSLCMKE